MSRSETAMSPFPTPLSFLSMKSGSDSDHENAALSLCCMERNDYGEVGEPRRQRLVCDLSAANIQSTVEIPLGQSLIGSERGKVKNGNHRLRTK